MKKCPNCAEIIEDDAAICRFCGHRLVKQIATDDRAFLTAQTPPSEKAACFTSLVENSQDFIFHYRFWPSPGFVYVNPAAVHLTGYLPEEFYQDSQLFYKLVNPIDRPTLIEIIQSDAVVKNPLVLRYIRKDGNTLWVEQQFTLTHDSDGNLISVESSVRDITERQQRSNELEAVIAMGAAMRNAITRDELVTIFLDQCIKMLNVQGTALITSDPLNGEAMIEKGCGLFLKTSGLHLPEDASLMALSGLKEPIEADSPGLAGMLFASLMLPQGIRFISCAPLIIQQEIIGILLVESTETTNESQRRLILMVIEVAANALQRTSITEKARVYNNLMATAGKLGLMLAKTLDLPAIYTQAGQFMGAMFPDIAGLFVALYDSACQILTCVYAIADGKVIDVTSLPPIPLGPPGIGNQSRAVHTRRPVIIADMNEGRKQSQVDVVVGDRDEVARSGLFIPMLAKDKVIGVVNIQSYQINRFTQQDAEVLTLVSNTTAMAIENARLVQGLLDTNRDLVDAYDATIMGWTLALDLRDHETEGHSLRVAEMTVQMARTMGMGEDEIIHIRRGALLHDIGKLGIPDAILNKPGTLTNEEWIIMRTHPQNAYTMLSQVEYLRPALDIPYCHHEKWDGSGYPRGLKGEQIPSAARLFALVDVWDALLSDRPYRQKWTVEKVVDYIQSQIGTHFDPRAGALFLNSVKNFRI